MHFVLNDAIVTLVLCVWSGTFLAYISCTMHNILSLLHVSFLFSVMEELVLHLYNFKLRSFFVKRLIDLLSVHEVS